MGSAVLPVDLSCMGAILTATLSAVALGMGGKAKAPVLRLEGSAVLQLVGRILEDDCRADRPDRRKKDPPSAPGAWLSYWLSQNTHAHAGGNGKA